VAALSDLVGNADLPERRLLQRQIKDHCLDLRCGPILQKRLAPRQLLQRDFTPGVIELLEPVEAIA